MEGSKLIELLKTFNTQELREFKEFVHSPYFNKNKELMLFCDYLKKIAPVFPPKKIDRHKVYQSLFPKKKYDDRHFKYLMSFLLKLAEQYIGIRKYRQQDILVQSHILHACIERNLEKHYSNLYQKSFSQLQSNPLRDSDYYYERYLLSETANLHFASKKLRKFNVELQQAADFFDVYYLTQKLKYSCEMLSMQRFLSADYSQNLIDEISRFLKRSLYDDVPAIALYYQVFLSLTDENNEAHFNKLKALIKEHVHHFTPSEMKEFYLHAINFCIRKIRQKDEKYVEEALTLYSEAIENGVILENGYLSPWTYKNVVKLGLRLNRYDWTEQFITAYAGILEEQFRLNAINYGLADLSFHQGEKEKALIHLRQVEFSDIFFTLDAKIMLLKIYFDNNDHEPLYSLLASFKIFLKRNKLISNEVRETYINFITFLSKILKGDKNSMSTLKQEITDSKLLTDQNWLLQRVAINIE